MLKSTDNFNLSKDTNLWAEKEISAFQFIKRDTIHLFISISIFIFIFLSISISNLYTSIIILLKCKYNIISIIKLYRANSMDINNKLDKIENIFIKTYQIKSGLFLSI